VAVKGYGTEKKGCEIWRDLLSRMTARAYWAMRRETGQLSLNLMTMIHVPDGPSFYSSDQYRSQRNSTLRTKRHVWFVVSLSALLPHRTLWLTNVMHQLVVYAADVNTLGGSNSMQLSPSCETNRFSATQEITLFYGSRRFITAFTKARLYRRSFRNVTTLFRVRRCQHLAHHQTKKPPLVGCPRLLTQYIRSYPPYLQAVPLTATWGRAMPWWQRHNTLGGSIHTTEKNTEASY
jgi:hypothetical protein